MSRRVRLFSYYVGVYGDSWDACPADYREQRMVIPAVTQLLSMVKVNLEERCWVTSETLPENRKFDIAAERRIGISA